MNKPISGLHRIPTDHLVALVHVYEGLGCCYDPSSTRDPVILVSTAAVLCTRIDDVHNIYTPFFFGTKYFVLRAETA